MSFDCSIVGLDQSLTHTAIHHAYSVRNLGGENKAHEQGVDIEHNAYAILTDMTAAGKKKASAKKKARKSSCTEGEKISPYIPKDEIDRIIHVQEKWRSLLLDFDVQCGANSTRRAVYMEGYAMGSKFLREALGELGGALKSAARQRLWDIYVVAPGTLKKFTVRQGKAEKERVMMEVLDRWGYKATDNNDADAYALTRLGVFHQFREYLEVPKYVAECFASIKYYPAVPP